LDKNIHNMITGVFQKLVHTVWKNEKFSATQFFSSNRFVVNLTGNLRKTVAVKFRNFHNPECDSTICAKMLQQQYVVSVKIQSNYLLY